MNRNPSPKFQSSTIHVLFFHLYPKDGSRRFFQNVAKHQTSRCKVTQYKFLCQLELKNEILIIKPTSCTKFSNLFFE